MPEESVEDLEISPVTVKQIKTWTDHGLILATVQRFIKQGWPKSVKEVGAKHSRLLYTMEIIYVIVPKPRRE